MEQQKNKNGKLKTFFKCVGGGVGTAGTVITWEVLEETLENVIAVGISSFFAGVVLVLCTQFIKVGVKKLLKLLLPLLKILYPIVKKHIHKTSTTENNIKEKEIKMTKSTLLQKILTTILAVFGLGGVVVYFLPQFTPIASQVTDYCAMIGEIIAVVSGIWLSQTSDKVLTNEEIAKIEEDKKNKQLAKDKALIAKNEKTAKKLEEAKNRVAEAESKKV